MSEIQHVQSPLVNVERRSRSEARPFEFVLALLVAAVFLYAGVLKAWEPIKFAEDIQKYHILSWPLGVRLAFYLPWLEIICALALLIRGLRRGAAAILTLLTLVFIAVTIAAKVRGINLDCGCFGSAAKNLPFAWHLVIDFALLGALLLLVRLRRRS
jgi:uncharacterized membrane protein YphA (DoxX/SURF4 family)